jgi:hypothetical protein
VFKAAGAFKCTECIDDHGVVIAISRWSRSATTQRCEVFFYRKYKQLAVSATPYGVDFHLSVIDSSGGAALTTG